MFLDGSLLNKAFMTLCYGGSFFGFVAGFLAAANAIDPVQGVQVAIIAVITAMVGLFGGVAIPAFRLWLEYRDKMRNDLRQVVDQVAAHLDETQKKVEVLLANQEEHKKQHAQRLPPENLG